MKASRRWVVLARVVGDATVRLESRHWTSRGALKSSRFLNGVTFGFVAYWVEPIGDARNNYPNLELK